MSCPVRENADTEGEEGIVGRDATSPADNSPFAHLLQTLMAVLGSMEIEEGKVPYVMIYLGTFYYLNLPYLPGELSMFARVLVEEFARVPFVVVFFSMCATAMATGNGKEKVHLDANLYYYLYYYTCLLYTSPSPRDRG